MQRHNPIIHQNPHQRFPLHRTLHHLDIRARRKRDSPRSRVPVCLCGGLSAVLREWLRTIVQAQREEDGDHAVVVAEVSVEGGV